MVANLKKVISKTRHSSLLLDIPQQIP